MFLICLDSPNISLFNGENRSSLSCSYQKLFNLQSGAFFFETDSSTGGLDFEGKHDIILYDNCHVILVQTSASIYHRNDTMEIRVVVTNENLMPIEHDDLII
jgi:hypothetical protein